MEAITRVQAAIILETILSVLTGYKINGTASRDRQVECRRSQIVDVEAQLLAGASQAAVPEQADRSQRIRLDEGSEDHERMMVFGFVLAGESRLTRDKLAAPFFCIDLQSTKFSRRMVRSRSGSQIPGTPTVAALECPNV